MARRPSWDIKRFDAVTKLEQENSACHQTDQGFLFLDDWRDLGLEPHIVPRYGDDCLHLPRPADGPEAREPGEPSPWGPDFLDPVGCRLAPLPATESHRPPPQGEKGFVCTLSSTYFFPRLRFFF